METQKDVEILFVEDNPNDVEMAMRAFKKNNFVNHIVHMEFGTEALDFLFARGNYSGRKTERNPKLIMLDLKLPGLSGLEVLKVIKTDPRTKRIPVVVMTSSKEERDIFESYELGVNSYIVKPVDFNKLVDAVKGIGLYWLLLNETPM